MTSSIKSSSIRSSVIKSRTYSGPTKVARSVAGGMSVRSSPRATPRSMTSRPSSKRVVQTLLTRAPISGERDASASRPRILRRRSGVSTRAETEQAQNHVDTGNTGLSLEVVADWLDAVEYPAADVSSRPDPAWPAGQTGLRLG